MNQSDLILEFIDGTLDTQLEQGLFSDMARHPELRAELRQYVMIGDAVRADREAYVPSAEVERRLLGGLGVLPLAEAGAGGAAAMSGASAGGAAAAGSLLLSKLRGALLPLLVGFVVGGLFAGGSVYLSMNGSSADVPGERLAAETRPADGAATSVHSDRESPLASTTGMRTDARNGNDVPAAHSGSMNIASRTLHPSMTANKGSNASTPSASRSRGGNDNEGLQTAPEPVDPPHGGLGEDVSAQQNDAQPLASTIAVRANSDRFKYTDPVESRLIEHEGTDNLIDSNVERESARSPMSSGPEFLANPDNSADDGSPLSLELRGLLGSRPFVDNNALAVQGGIPTEDMVGGLYWSPNSQWYVGLEGGRERFTQKLFYNQEDTLFIEQRPVINWGTVALGMNLKAFDVPFFVQGNIGASQYGGPMFRGRAGIDLFDALGVRSLQGLSIPVSVEASSLVYMYNNQYLATGNWGLSVGARYRIP